MCVGFWKLDDPVYSLILCTNRDEFLARSTLPAHFHNFEHPIVPNANAGNVLSGIDVQAGGSWLGANKQGRVALLTNITEPFTSHKLSRGELVSSFLAPADPSLSLHQYVEAITSQTPVPPDYGGFNLLLLQPSGNISAHNKYEGYLVTNSGGGKALTYRPLTDPETACGGLSNGVDGHTVDGLGSSLPWTKVSGGIPLLRNAISRHRSRLDGNSDQTLVMDLMDLLDTTASTSPQTREQLRTSILIPPFILQPPLKEVSPKSNFVGAYGTRLSTVILVHRETGNVTFVERDKFMLSDGVVQKGGEGDERVFSFTLKK